MIILNAVRLTPIKMVEICAFFLFLGALLKSFIFSKQHFKCPFLTRIFIYVFILGLGRMDMIRRNWRNISSIIINLLKCKILNYHKINGNFKSCKHKLLLIRICCTFINCIIQYLKNLFHNIINCYQKKCPFRYHLNYGSIRTQDLFFANLDN